MNQFTWHLCDSCGQRLPWSKPKAVKPISEMSDEELAARFVGLEPKKQSFFFSEEGKKVRWITFGVISTVLGEIVARIFHMPF